MTRRLCSKLRSKTACRPVLPGVIVLPGGGDEDRLGDSDKHAVEAVLRGRAGHVAILEHFAFETRQRTHEARAKSAPPPRSRAGHRSWKQSQFNKPVFQPCGGGR